MTQNEDEALQDVFDNMVIAAAVGGNIPLRLLAFNDEQLKRIETKLKTEHENDTN